MATCDAVHGVIVPVCAALTIIETVPEYDEGQTGVKESYRFVEVMLKVSLIDVLSVPGYEPGGV